MEVIVKNCSLSKTNISKIAYNHVNNIIACNIEGNDTILFFKFDQENLSFVEIFKGMPKPPGSKISISWSPDGKYIALGGTSIQLWEFKDGRLKPLKSFQQDFIEVKLIQWSVDSLSFASGGISQKNTIKIRNIQTSKVKQIQLPEHQTISSISFDPYGKYLLLFLRNNTMQIYSVANYQKFKSIRFSPQFVKINPIKQIRTTSWSPDFNFFVCPSLDDSRINIAINLSRNKDFKVKNVFMGHCSPISCCKFNPKLFKWNQQITAIIAMGDSSGNLSIWRVGAKNQYPQPLLLSNSLQNSMEVVEDLEWDEKGQVLMINMMKKYINAIKFTNKRKDFGVQLSNEEVFSLIQQTYGSSRATDINRRQIQVFDVNNSGWTSMEQEHKIETILIEPQKPIEKQQQQLISCIQEQNNNPVAKNELQTVQNTSIVEEKHELLEINPNIHLDPETVINLQSHITNLNLQPQPIQLAHLLCQEKPAFLPLNVETERQQKKLHCQANQYIKLTEQKTIIGKNNKKKIQPAMLIRKSQIQDAAFKNKTGDTYSSIGASFGSSLGGSFGNSLFFNNQMVQTFPSLQFPHITFTQKQVNLSKNRILQVKKLSKATSVQLVDLLDDSNSIARRIFPSTIDYIFFSQDFIYVLNQQFLYIFDLELNPKELPLKVGQVHRFLANGKGQVYFINCDGYLIGFDHVKNISKTICPVPLHILLRDNSTKPQGPAIKQFMLTKNSDLFVTIINPKQNKNGKLQRFLYDPKKNSWVTLNIAQGVFEEGISIKISQNEENLMKSFFFTLCPSLKQRLKNKQNYETKNSNTTGSVLSVQQQCLIFFQKHQRDPNKFENALIQNLKWMKQQHKSNQFRNFINQYFFNKESINYINNEQKRSQLWKRVNKQVSSTIVDQFMVGNTVQQLISLQ